MATKRYGEICRKCEDVMESHIRKSALELITSSIQVIKGFDLTEVDAERVEIVAETAEQELIGSDPSGSWTVSGTLAYVYNYADLTRAEAEAKASELFDIFLQPNINNLLNANKDESDFWMNGGSPDGEVSLGTGFEIQRVTNGVVDQHTRHFTANFTAYCRPYGSEI